MPKGVLKKNNLNAIFKNIAWLFVERLSRMILGFFIGVWVARYLGAEKYGALMYSLAFVSIFNAISTLGLNGVAVREFVNNPKSKWEILSSLIILQFLGGVFATILIFIVGKQLEDGNDFFINSSIVLGFAQLLKSIESFKYWFESQVSSKYSSLAEFSAYLIACCIRAWGIYEGKDIWFFVLVYLVESFFTLFGLALLFILKNKNIKFIPHLGWISIFLKEGWPIIISATLVLVNLQVDRVMLGRFASSTQVGIYSAANTLISVWYFIPTLVVGSFSADLVRLYAEDINKYHLLSVKLHKFFGGLMLLIALIFSIFSDIIIDKIYGVAFEGAAGVLAVSVFAIIFVFQVSLRGRLLIIEGMQMYGTFLVFAGVILNIAMNLLLIPYYGAIGAACAYVISWALSALVLPLIFEKTRKYPRVCLGLS
jgi:PST family polysaccharide transporter